MVITKELKETGLIILGVIVILLAVYFGGRYLERKRAEKEDNKAITPDKLPNSGNGVPLGWSPSNLAKRLNEAITGISLAWAYDGREQLFTELARLPTDDMFKLVFLDYYRMFDVSLVDDIADEWAFPGSDTAELKGIIINRASSLGIA